MSDCECEKNKTRDNWIDDGDYGDNFLREDSFNVIDKIKRGLTYYGFNENAIFNKKMGQREIEDMNLDEVNIDYSYLNDDDEIELLDETIEEEYFQNRENSPILEEVSMIGDDEVTPSEIDVILDENVQVPIEMEEVSVIGDDEVTPSEIDVILDEVPEETEEIVYEKPRIPTVKIITDKELDEILKDDLI